MSDEHRVFDVGLQPERTALAWRRTALSLLVATVVGARLLAPVLGTLALVLGGLGATVAGWLWVASGRRSRRTAVLLLGDGDLHGDSGAGLHLTAAATCVVAGLLSLLVLAPPQR